MQVKKFGGKVFGAVLTAAERKAMELEINRQLAEYDRQHMNDMDALVLWVLHVHLGFGVKRLRRFYEAFSREYDRLVHHYEMPDDGAWLCRKQLKEIGVDVEKWNQERGTT